VLRIVPLLIRSTFDLLQPEFMGTLHLVEGVSSLSALAIYNLYLTKVSYRNILYWTIVLSFIAGLTVSSTTILLQLSPFEALDVCTVIMLSDGSLTSCYSDNNWVLGCCPQPLILILHLNREWGIPDMYFVGGDAALLAGVGQVMILVLISSSCSTLCM